MTDDIYLGEFEQLVLLAVLRHHDGAHGMLVRRELGERARRAASIGAVYATLDRLEGKGLVASGPAPGGPEREGRVRRVFRVTAAGRRALVRVRATVARMTAGLGLERA